jgi:serine O-acetyltransferase
MPASLQGSDPSTGAAPKIAAQHPVIAELQKARGAWRARHGHDRDVTSFPSREGVEGVVADLGAALFPRRLGGFRRSDAGEDGFVAERLEHALRVLQEEVSQELGYWQIEADADFEADQAATIVALFTQSLPEIRRLIDSDVEAAFIGDPAARSVDEILLCYPGAVASLHYRIAHVLYGLGAPIVARLISELANERTGIDIHPGATVGSAFFIDHGTGVVIGETAILGERVRLYQHVTLGAHTPLADTRDPKRDRHARHPIIGDNVVIYAGATLLGRITVGSGATIGGNVWLVSDVPVGATVLQPEAQSVSSEEAFESRLRVVGA